MDERGQFTFYRSFWDAIQILPQKDQLPLLKAVISYALDGQEISGLSPHQRASFLLIKPTLDSSRKKAANGKQGGSKPKANASKPKANASEKEGEIEKEKEYECTPPTPSTFTPPTVSEVRDYCRERKNRVDPQRFVDFYTSKGWMVGKTKMKDWKAAVRTWEKDDEPKGDTVTFMQMREEARS